MLRQLVCYRRFFPFYLRTPSQSLLSRTSASQCLILLVTGGGPDICHYVFCRQIVNLHILHFAYLYSASLHIFGHFSLHVLSSDLLFAYFALSCCWSLCGISAEGIDEKEFPEMTFLTEALFCYRGTFLWYRGIFKHLIPVNFIQEHFVFVFVNSRLLIFWLGILHLLLPHLFSCSPVWGQVVKSQEPVLEQRSSCCW